MPWENIEKMFPTGGTPSDLGYLTNKYIKDNNLPKVELTISRPVRNMIEYEEKLVYYPDGKLDRFYTYMVFPYRNVDGTPLLNVFAQKAYSDFMEKRKEKKESSDE